MDGVERKKSLKERLGFKGISCCGATWVFRPSSTAFWDDDENDEDNVRLAASANISDQGCLDQTPAATMNLATALAAERHYRAVQDSDGGGVIPVGTTNNRPGGITVGTATPLRASLMRLLAETNGGDGESEGREEVGNDSLCCVCMGRKKDAAFIPCGHTFCRVCSRELWLDRGCCPICNRPIVKILDIF
ncbi:hypothetical protein U1Q18_008834 [Sarracenia purpurea var. burkii]